MYYTYISISFIVHDIAYFTFFLHSVVIILHFWRFMKEEKKSTSTNAINIDFTLAFHILKLH